MTSGTIDHYVFVDFENVPTVDLGPVSGKPVHVTLLIGKKQTKLDLPLVRQIHSLAAQVELVEVGASGPNALDLTLAYYLGRAVVRTPGGQFHIVSKDKDFDPLIAHLTAREVRVSRHEAFAALPFLAASKPGKPRQPKPPRPPKGAPAKSVVPPGPVATGDDRFERLVSRLKNNLAPRPKKRSGLLARIKTDFGNKLSEAEADEKLESLVRRSVLVIEDKDRVRYL